MPEIPISREQEAYLQALKEELDDEVPYGHVRIQDAVQYLIDHHREDGDLDIEVRDVAAEGDGNRAADDGDGQAPSSAEGGTGSGGNGESGGSDSGSDADGGTAPEGGPGGGGTEAEAGSEGNAESGGSASAGATTTESGGSVDDTVAALGNAGPGGSGSSDGGSTGETDASGESSGTIGNAGGDMVDEMMNLMDAHDGVWEETDSSEGKYRVELPEGDTENVPTKDDVRALLFKHYR